MDVERAETMLLSAATQGGPGYPTTGRHPRSGEESSDLSLAGAELLAARSGPQPPAGEQSVPHDAARLVSMLSCRLQEVVAAVSVSRDGEEGWSGDCFHPTVRISGLVCQTTCTPDVFVPSCVFLFDCCHVLFPTSMPVVIVAFLQRAPGRTVTSFSPQSSCVTPFVLSPVWQR